MTSFIREARATLKLALPLMIGQLSQMLLGVADTIMVGQLGVVDLAALTFASSLFYMPFVFGIGLISGVTVLTANARGAGDFRKARASCRDGLQLGVSLGLVLFLFSWWLSHHLDFFGQPAEVVAHTPAYFLWAMASTIPGLGSIALKNHADALNRPWQPFWIFLAGVLLNIGLNWVLIFGKFGMPEMGLAGAGAATFIARCAMLFGVWAWLLRAKGLREWVPYRWLRLPKIDDLRRILHVGIPASLQMLCEVAAFSASGLIMGFFGPIAMAAHQVAITCASTAFMVPLGLSMALSVRIGEANGAGEYQRLRPIVASAWGLAALYSLITAAIFLVSGRQIASWFIDAREVIDLAGTLLIVVGIFQLFDSLQVSSSAMLRGLHDARVPAVVGFVSYWMVGLPVAWWFAFNVAWRATGVWSGLAAGLLVACVALTRRLWRRTCPRVAARLRV